MQEWCGPSRRLEDVRPELLVEYLQAVIRQRNYAPATEQKHIKSIKTFWNWAVRLDLVAGSPARVIRGRKLPKAVDRHRAMTDEELHKLLDAVRFKPRDYALVLFLADTGCRRGGAAGLRMQDLDLSRLVAEITEKGDKTRKVAFGEECAKALAAWIGYRSQRYAIRGVYIFSQHGEAIKADALSLAIRRACKSAGIRVLSPHSLRHRKGHQMADARIAPSIAATALGHSDPMITLNYYYPKDWERAEAAMRELATKPDMPASPANVVQYRRGLK